MSTTTQPSQNGQRVHPRPPPPPPTEPWPGSSPKPSPSRRAPPPSPSRTTRRLLLRPWGARIRTGAEASRTSPSSSATTTPSTSTTPSAPAPSPGPPTRIHSPIGKASPLRILAVLGVIWGGGGGGSGLLNTADLGLVWMLSCVRWLQDCSVHVLPLSMRILVDSVQYDGFIGGTAHENNPVL